MYLATRYCPTVFHTFGSMAVIKFCCECFRRFKQGFAELRRYMYLAADTASVVSWKCLGMLTVGSIVWQSSPSGIEYLIFTSINTATIAFSYPTIHVCSGIAKNFPYCSHILAYMYCSLVCSSSKFLLFSSFVQLFWRIFEMIRKCPFKTRFS